MCLALFWSSTVSGMVQQRNAPHASFDNNNNKQKKKARISALKTTVIHSLIRRFIIKPEILCFTMTDSQWAVLSPVGSGGFAERRVVPCLEEATALKKTQENTSLFYGSNKHTNKKTHMKKIMPIQLSESPSVCLSVRLLISLYGSTLFNCTGSFIFRAVFVEKFIVK